jgi:hypothetical protein
MLCRHVIYRGKNMTNNWNKNCKNECGAYGYRWGSLGGFCTNCKHTENVGCKCILQGCNKIYWNKTASEKRIANKRGKQ